jgi:hypothetical protein
LNCANGAGVTPGSGQVVASTITAAVTTKSYRGSGLGSPASWRPLAVSPTYDCTPHVRGASGLHSAWVGGGVGGGVGRAVGRGDGRGVGRGLGRGVG